MKKLFLTCFCCASAVLGARAQDEHIVIWDNASAPTSSGLFGPTVIEKEVFVANNNVAELFVYKAEEPSGRAVVVCPGGGYHNLAIGYEGHDMARWLADHGTTAAVLKYRMPNGHCEVPRNDAEQALRITIPTPPSGDTTRRAWGSSVRRREVIWRPAPERSRTRNPLS